MDNVRKEVNNYIKEKYCAEPEFLWQSDPDSCIYRRRDNRKWFGIIMVIPRTKLGLEGEGKVEILNLKLTDRLSVDLLTQRDGIFPPYHMSKGTSWITVLLDGTVSLHDIYPLVDESYGVTAPKNGRKKRASDNKSE